MYKSSLAAIVLMAVTHVAQAAPVEVIDSEPVSSPSSGGPGYGAVGSSAPLPRVVPATAAESNFSQMQAIQDEVQQLRGLVEQQANEIKRLKQQREDDYADIDRRLSVLTRSGHGGQAADDAQALSDGKKVSSDKAEKKSPQSQLAQKRNNLPEPETSQNDLSEAELQAKPRDDREGEIAQEKSNSNRDTADSSGSTEDEFASYSAALNLIIKSKDYDQGAQAMSRYLAQFPKGKYAPNAHFWVGHAYQNQNKPDKAVEAYEKMIKKFPREPKSDEARLKLARVYLQRGEKEEARLMLDEIIEGGGPQSKAAGDLLAKNF